MSAREQSLEGARKPSLGVVTLRALWARIAGWVFTFCLAAVTAILPMVNAVFEEAFNPARFGAALALLLLIQLARYPRILFTREFAIYACLLAYMSLSVAWTPDREYGINTLIPAANCLIILMLLGSLVAFHDLGAVLSGLLSGFLTGAAAYTVLEGYPFRRPVDFSYNAIAGMYLFGLFAVLAWGWYTKRRFPSLVIATVTWLLIASTTSIKTNLGVAIGVFAGFVMYLQKFAHVLGRSLMALGVVSLVAAYIIMSNDALLERFAGGFGRVTTGVKILNAREDVGNGTSFNQRQDWQEIGLAGWRENPVFGHGVEGFRADVGITSHSTPIDALYNGGLIAFTLFYALFASLMWRLYAMRRAQLQALPILILAGAVCYLFMSLTEPLHYNSFFGVFVAVSVGLLSRAAAGRLD